MDTIMQLNGLSNQVLRINDKTYIRLLKKADRAWENMELEQEEPDCTILPSEAWYSIFLVFDTELRVREDEAYYGR